MLQASRGGRIPRGNNTVVHFVSRTRSHVSLQTVWTRDRHRVYKRVNSTFSMNPVADQNNSCNCDDSTQQKWRQFQSGWK